MDSEVRTGRRSLFIGFIVWAVATALLVPYGHVLFSAESRLRAGLWSASIVVATFVGVYRLARALLPRAARLEQGALIGAALCLPGLALDGALYALNAGRYPRLDDSGSGMMTVTLLLAYAAALASAQLAALRSLRNGGNR